ncbi:ryanodine receptor 2, partial [Salvelinus sp. IW2-2015]|uniref:ryanodine receptor 2 n=1 Tax=Salvelinus sp. IW2-2015 TaxID=2691554 RepID=UPI0038D4D933
MEKLRKKAATVLLDEEQMKAEGRGEMSEAELLILDEFTILIRDLYAFYPLLIRLLDYNRAKWLKESNPEAEELFRMVAEVFIFWSKSHNFKREEQNFVVQNEINNMSFLITDTKSKMSKGAVSDQERKKMKRKGDRYSMQTSLIVAALKRLLPVGLNICAPGDQELIALAKIRFSQKDTEDEVREIIRNNLHLQGKYRVFHFKKLVKKLILVMKWMKSQQASKPPALEMPGVHKRLAGARKRSATMESSYTHRAPRTTLAGIKKASSVDHVMHHGQGQGKAPVRATDILGTSRIREGHLGALGQS